MRGKDIVIGVLILAVIAGTISWLRGRSVTSQPQVTLEMEEKMETTFNLDIPDDVEKTELTDVSGGTASGIATRNYDGSSFTHTVLADLPDPIQATVYEGWLVRGKAGDNNFKFVSTGVMQIAKGGYLLQFESDVDLTAFTGVVITLEQKVDATAEKHILEGSF